MTPFRSCVPQCPCGHCSSHRLALPVTGRFLHLGVVLVRKQRQNTKHWRTRSAKHRRRWGCLRRTQASSKRFEQASLSTARVHPAPPAGRGTSLSAPSSPPEPAAAPARSLGRGIAPATTSAVLTGIVMAGAGLAAPRRPPGPPAASSPEHPGHDDEYAEHQHCRDQHLLHGRQRHGRRLPRLPAAAPSPAPRHSAPGGGPRHCTAPRPRPGSAAAAARGGRARLQSRSGELDREGWRAFPAANEHFCRKGFNKSEEDVEKKQMFDVQSA